MRITVLSLAAELVEAVEVTANRIIWSIVLLLKVAAPVLLALSLKVMLPAAVERIKKQNTGDRIQ